MRSVLDAPWFYWALSVAVGFPAALIVLTEVHNALQRRGSPLARPVQLVRNYILPLGALLVLLVPAMQVSGNATGVRVVATAFGFVVLVLLLSGLNATLFQGAPEGTWRKRIPSIFLDVARFALIAIGVGVMLAFIWGANVGGLFAALGVSSIVLGLALQNSVGQIISGLLVLFEQPFRLGDWVHTTSVRGRVVEVNWRATHIDTGVGLQIIPNSALAEASFTNLSRPTGTHVILVETLFSVKDPPDEVCAMLTRVAGSLPHLRPREEPVTFADGSTEIPTRRIDVGAGSTKYTTSIPLHSAGDDFAAKSTFLRWVWYVSRRAGLHLDEAEDDFATPERVQRALRRIAPALRLTSTDQEELLPHARLTRYGTDETIQPAGQVPDRMTFVVSGRVRLVANGEDGSVITVRTVEEGDFLGQTALTREPVAARAYAVTPTTVVQFERERIEQLVTRDPELLRDISRAIEDRRATLQRLLATAP